MWSFSRAVCLFFFLGSLLALAFTEPQQKRIEHLQEHYRDKTQGPTELFETTVRCDKERLAIVENSLSGDDVETVEYRYVLYAVIRDHNISNVEIRETNLNEKAIECIKKDFLERVSFPSLPKRGIIPVSVYFPVFVTAKNLPTHQEQKQKTGQTGAVFGDGPPHCFHFKTPNGWILDSTSGKAENIPMVFFPAGSSWKDSRVVMYAKAAVLSEKVRTIQDQVDHTAAFWRDAYGYQRVPRLLKKVQSRSGSEGWLYVFPPEKNERAEYAIYFMGRNTIHFFVLLVPSSYASEFLSVLEELALSYQEGAEGEDCSHYCRDL